MKCNTKYSCSKGKSFEFKDYILICLNISSMWTGWRIRVVIMYTPESKIIIQLKTLFNAGIKLWEN